ncbi:hypothetical protein LguiA_018858 [Lonicera macranthoides]
MANTGRVVTVTNVDKAHGHERTWKISNEDKESGNYERYTAKEKASSGERYVEKGSERVGVKDECTRSSKVKIGNKNGYTEIYKEERFRNVDFSKNNNNNKTVITYDSDSDSGYDDYCPYDYTGSYKNYCSENSLPRYNYDSDDDY